MTNARPNPYEVTSAVEVRSDVKRWRFKPHSIGPYFLWGIVLFLGIRLLIVPLAEGVYDYITKTQELNNMRLQYQETQKQIAQLEKTRDFMKTPAYIEERAHQIGLIKSNESQMVVVDSPPGTVVKTQPRKKVEIGD
ncbi:MAG TPA: septum formation initiator family protein [Bacillota bacterium]